MKSDYEFGKRKKNMNCKKKKYKSMWRLWAWNMREVSGKEHELIESIEKSDIEILALMETKKESQNHRNHSSGIIELDNGHLLIYIGGGENERARAGETCLIKQNKIPSFRKWESVKINKSYWQTKKPKIL